MKKLHTWATSVLDEAVEEDIIEAVSTGNREELEKLLAFAKTCDGSLHYYYLRVAEVNALGAVRAGTLVARE